ncbi:MAG: transcription-repair coupling factor, partial [Gammaproteobacteria bacterium]|nr:transcription-repair coupling factor [Gammaproteobacteria bacterium]
HKLLQESVKYKDLGLLIIDEEHRFGVGQKEKIKKMRANIDILNLTATPIPRTLNLALSGIRDLSIITTPPQKRLAIKTFLYERSRELICEAISRELKRGGQVYFLHNNIKTIDQTYQEVADLFPEAKITTAHGQMRERELEKIMSDFYHRRYHILICTTIIETGIDIPSANTILIDRADKLGLAQLHQLRGRVGRSHHQAYAYLFKPKDAKISPDAEKRLEAISKLENLGAGFVLASHDMEIRGTGNLLGDEQSGHIEAIGYNLYMELLNKTVTALKAGEVLDCTQLEQESCEVDLKLSSLLPEEYIPDVNQRLILYKRIASVSNQEQLLNLKFEITDRFGKLPEAVNNLFTATEIKLKAQPIGITKIDIGNNSGKIKFNTKPKVNHAELMSLIRKEYRNYKLAGSDLLNFTFPMENLEQKYNTITTILDRIKLP